MLIFNQLITLRKILVQTWSELNKFIVLISDIDDAIIRVKNILKYKNIEIKDYLLKLSII